MSGGHFNYYQCYFNIIAEDIQELIETNNETNEWGYSHDYPDEVIEIFSQVERELRIMCEKIHTIDYLVCDDYGIDTFLEKWNEIKNRYDW